ncbi:MAG: ABC transporter substrate-binding protein [Pseudomonadota bacterium]
MNWLISVLVTVAIGFLPATQAAAPAPDQMVRETTDHILSLIRKNRALYQNDQRKLYAMVDQHVLPHFDFRKMSALVLGSNWREADGAQRDRFTSEFRQLLVRTYATALLKYNDEKVVMLPYRAALPDDRTVTVKTEVRRAGQAPIPINYDFYLNRDGQWKVYDVSIEGVSIVTSYTNTYAERIRRDGLEKLIASLSQDSRGGKPRGTQ